MLSDIKKCTIILISISLVLYFHRLLPAAEDTVISASQVLKAWEVSQKDSLECRIRHIDDRQDTDPRLATVHWCRGVGLRVLYDDGTGFSNVNGRETRIAKFEPQGKRSPKWTASVKANHNLDSYHESNAIRFWLNPLETAIAEELSAMGDQEFICSNGQYGREVSVDLKWGGGFRLTLAEKFLWRPISLRALGPNSYNIALVYASIPGDTFPLLSAYAVEGKMRSGKNVFHQINLISDSVEWRKVKAVEIGLKIPHETMLNDGTYPEGVTLITESGEKRRISYGRMTHISQNGGSWDEVYAAAVPFGDTFLYGRLLVMLIAAFAFIFLAGFIWRRRK